MVKKSTFPTSGVLASLCAGLCISILCVLVLTALLNIIPAIIAVSKVLLVSGAVNLTLGLPSVRHTLRLVYSRLSFSAIYFRITNIAVLRLVYSRLSRTTDIAV